ncbi:MAG: flagellar biosynthesis anti-sigma factor FlgM [Phycisphaerales bacterium]
MSDIAPVSGVPSDRFDTAPAPGYGPATRSAQPTRRPSDRVELSDRARLLSKLNAMPDIRQDLVDRIRREIAEGSYDSAERMDRAIDALTQEMGQEG